MKTLWFKSCYVTPILTGDKRDTIRRRAACKLRAGDVVAFSVGPRTPFATAKIVKRHDIELDGLPSGRASQVTAIYDSREPLCRLVFKIL